MTNRTQSTLEANNSSTHYWPVYFLFKGEEYSMFIIYFPD